jgi:HSP20 family protein
MLTRFYDFNPSFSPLDELRRRFDRVFEDIDREPAPREAASVAVGPRVNLYDRGAELVLTADVPGLSEKDLQITLDRESLTIRGERKVTPPEGYTAHRRERESLKFARSFTLPAKVDPERASATVKDGVLTLTLAKAADAQPRQIAVKSALCPGNCEE